MLFQICPYFRSSRHRAESGNCPIGQVFDILFYFTGFGKFNHFNYKKTTVVTTNLAFNRWNEIIDDKVLVTAMVDRLTHKAILLNMTGKSYRMKETQEMMNQQI